MSYPPKMRWAPLLVLIVTLSACRNTRKDDFQLPGQTDLLIKKFSIRGADAVSEAELKRGLATKKSRWTAAGSVRWIPLLGSKKQYFNHVQWQQDLQRIRTYYYARGYFDAHIVSENIVEDRERKQVRIVLTINEGKPTKVSEIAINGIDDKELQAQLRKGISLSKGDVFTEQKYLDSRGLMRDLLAERGFAYASVEGRVVIEARKQQALVSYFVDTGPKSHFGDIEIVGSKQVPQSAIREAITFSSGEQFSPDEMQKTQERIYDLGVFSVVKVTAKTERWDEEEDEQEASAEEEQAEEEDDFDLDSLDDLMDEAQSEAEQRAQLDPAVPIRIEVREAKLWNVRVGAGVAADVSRQEAHGRVDWSSRNFLGGLRKLEHFNSAGYAWAPSVFKSKEERNEGVIVDSELRFQQPRFIERYTTFETRLRFQRDVEPGFNLISPTAKIALRRRFFRALTAEVSYNLALFLLTGLNPALLDPKLRLQPEYVLEYLEQRVALDYRNNFINPTRGWLAELKLQEATELIGSIPGVPLGGDFSYFAPELTLEGYLPVGPHVLAIRGRAASIYNIGSKQPPIPQRLTGGGADSMRAFGRQRLSLYSVSGEALPIGGFSRVEASVEPRIRLVREVGEIGEWWLAVFFDAATILPGPLFVVTDSNGAAASGWQEVLDTLLYGVGIGTYLVTPVGPIRIDVAYRLSNIDNDPRFRRCAIEPNIAGTCNGDFVGEASDPVRELVRSPWNVIIGIGHSF